jgi:NAD(P)-dependent dehydrogenase (short-subunit alcohol dehydrogenase family)
MPLRNRCVMQKSDFDLSAADSGCGQTTMKQRHPFYRKVIVVTGAASGIGLAVCHRFAADGAVVAMLDMDADALAAASAGLTVKGARVSTHVCDVTSESQCRDSIGTVIAQHDGIDLLFNNAGITQRGAFIDTETAVFHKVMAVNFFGSLYCTKAALHSLIARHGQIIVNESIAGIAPVLGRTGYSASKHALHGLFTSLRSEIRPTGAHVMIVCPGFIQTNLQRRALGCDGRAPDGAETWWS